ncbi:Uracil-DNA glycosylase [Handroanthus impetiginosus]|uniref:Uracil-DNA glycosylase n=1 Tax=Handroanthus impetiginosus TaxID=429701 RepID=A0A2G9GZ24_9LAMI|nr:Uracil-DNA glycosylase [Handroanthus impetiginosus]
MEVTEVDTGSQLKDIQIGCSWIPTTPAKPDSTKQQPICTNWQQNYTPANLVAQTNLSESERLPGDFQQVTQSPTAPACYSSTNLINVSSGSNNWRADEAKKSDVSGDNLYNFDTWHEVEVVNPYVYGEDSSADNKFPKLSNMSFQNLLALAHAGGNRVAVDNALTHTDFVATSSTSVPCFHPQIGGCQHTMSFRNSPLQDLVSSPGAKFDTELNMQNIRMDRSSIPSRPIFDLNSSPRTITDAASSKSISSFEPITPEKTNKAEHRQDSGTKELSIDVPAKKHTQENQITKDGVLELHETKEKSHLVTDQLCAATSTQLQENHKPDKGGTEEILLIKTPQQKPRRKKHRPKVIIEGQEKSTTKSSAGKHTVPQETTRVKRRYVRRKGVNNSLEGKTNGTDSNNNTPSSMDTPARKRRYVRRKETDNSEGNMDKGTTETTDIKSPGRTRSSCRRSLNFNSVGQAGDECSSYCPSSNCNKELQAENSNEKDQARILHSKGGMEVMTEKNDTGISQELSYSMNQAADLQASQQHIPNMDQLKDDHNMFTDQITRIRGKCQIVFSDVTHDKEANIVQVRMNSDCQRTPKSPIGSTCSSTCLPPERQVRGLKRQNMTTSVDAELPNRNDIGAFYNSLQAYLPIFSRNADRNNANPGLHFPVIYKKKRTEKGHNMVTSSSQYTESTSDNHVKHALRDSCSKLFIATTNQGSPGFQGQVSNLLSTTHTADGTQNGRQVFEDLLALGPTEKIKKRRSKGNTRLRDLASLLEICKELPASPSRAFTSRIEQNADTLHEPHTCMEALIANARSTMTTKKRSRRSPLSNSTVQKMYNHQKSSTISIGKPLALTWKSMSPIDLLIEQLNQLDLNAESSHALAQNQNAFISFHTQYQEQALVPFQRCGDVIPFDNSFAQVRRRKPRPKVDLDDETTRVWKLLLENINSEGIDGTDEEKTRWWEEERRVFSGRADSFIARMRMVQGDRRFSPWKGSVVDSVIGVFLTQNVSDHLSSSAFMSLAAQFPIKSKTDSAELHEERQGNKEEPEIFVLDPDEPFGLNKEILNQSVCGGEDTKILQDFEDDSIREVNSVKSSGNSFDGFILKDNLSGQSSDTFIHGPVVSHETVTNKSTSLIDDGRDAEETLSSQTPEISSQNSADSPVAQTTERSDSCLPGTSEEARAAGVKPDKLDSTASFVKLLQIAGTVLQIDYKNSCDNKMSDQNQQMLSESSAVDLQNEGHLDNPTFPAETITSCSKSTCCRAPKLGAQATQHDLSQENTKFFKKELCTAETSELSSESASTSLQKITAVSFAEEPKSSSPNAHSSNNDQIDIHQTRVPNQTGQVSELSSVQENNYKMQEAAEIQIYPQNFMDITGSSSNLDNSKNLEHREVNSKHQPEYYSGKMVNGPKTKGGKTRKEKGDPVDWDNLRKEAQTCGRERTRTANTKDSVDWDAVRCADVNEIAQTIKERGMNNMLAERIKDFLNRLVRDHGSIDLEWLRDVPPDKAKEYLLSIRGLGLKSVECVRLLTLHHLAFPVDTNVGRIAVRLGWVPLQPLPESLQLHLLELYPVLESIQKYLWPRLCKLDQRTLYELHYQMITFGKVFCTKSKPNCNACPLRAECRHFASAFASARLALPAPEEKSIVSATENRTTDQDPMTSMNTLQLPSPQVNQMDITCKASSSQPIIEEPPSPEPIIEVPATPEPGYTQVPECNIESALNEDPDEIPTIQLNMEEFTHNLQKIMQQNTELQESDMSKALVALTSEAASIPVPKLKNVSRLRTEHRVYELPDSHPLLEGLDKREPDDPCPYLLAIWTPGETVNSIEPPEKRCNSQGSENLCTNETCSSCNSIREANSQTVRGTLLIPCRTAMRGSFPLNGTYFQVNEVFSDHESSLSPMDVPREWLWNLRRRTVFFGTSIPTIFKGLSTEGIQYCFWRGFVCVRGFDRKTRAPRPLTARLHFPGSKLAKGKGKGKIYENE